MRITTRLGPRRSLIKNGNMEVWAARGWGAGGAGVERGGAGRALRGMRTCSEQGRLAAPRRA